MLTQGGFRRSVGEIVHYFPYYVHMLIIWPGNYSFEESEWNRFSQSSKVVMVKQHRTDKWDFPYFVRPWNRGSSGWLDKCVVDLQNMLRLQPPLGRRAFAVIAELLGKTVGVGMNGSNVEGYQKLVLVEAHVPLLDIDLPPQAEWKDVAFVENLFDNCSASDGNYHALGTTLRYMYSRCDDIFSCYDRRMRFGWFDIASSRLCGVVHKDGASVTGPVIQEHVKGDSTLLSVTSSAGKYYLKAEAAGSNELNVTRLMFRLFPEICTEIVEVCEDIRGYVGKRKNSVRMYNRQWIYVLKQITRIQMESSSYVGELELQGMRRRCVRFLQERLSEWMLDYKGIMGDIFEDEFERFRVYARKMIKICKELENYNIPVTLIHGWLREGAVQRVCANGNVDFVVHDWQHAAVGTGVLEVHAVFDYMSDEDVVDYARMWGKYEASKRAERAVRLAAQVGGCVAICSDVEILRKCCLQRRADIAERVYLNFNAMARRIDEYWGTPNDREQW